MLGDPGKLDQILVNLIENAIDAIADGGSGSVVSVRIAGAPGRVLVDVVDDGPGIPEALRERVFEPMFTTRGDRGGTGLGLPIAREIAGLAFDGDIRIEENSRQGAWLRATLSKRGTRRRAHTAYEPNFAVAPALGGDTRGSHA